MTNNLRKTSARRMIALAGLSLLAVAATATALPLALSHDVGTPAGSVEASYSDHNAATCISPATPALPALPAVPAVPLPLPVALPGIPQLPEASAAAKVCADAGLDGVHASADADAMGIQASTAADADTSQQHDEAKKAVGGVKGFVGGLADTIKDWF